ncbi:hypothetical protein A9Q78_07395 [Methylophaga sp. 41_12_T18]|nr:hypothetical protein A9Q78_07395 [Methylophaga sp. 41_12_T18]
MSIASCAGDRTIVFQNAGVGQSGPVVQGARIGQRAIKVIVQRTVVAQYAVVAQRAVVVQRAVAGQIGRVQ